MEWNFYVY